MYAFQVQRCFHIKYQTRWYGEAIISWQHKALAEEKVVVAYVRGEMCLCMEH